MYKIKSEFLTNSINQVMFFSAYYVTLAITTIGHELGHAFIPWLYSENVKISIKPYLKAKTSHSCMKMPVKYFPVVSALGPVTGIITSLTILKTYHSFSEQYSKTSKNDLSLIHALIFNNHTANGVILGTVASCVCDVANLYINKPNFDGQQICNDLNLSPRQAFFTRHAMALSALAFVGSMSYILKLYQAPKTLLFENKNLVFKSLTLSESVNKNDGLNYRN